MSETVYKIDIPNRNYSNWSVFDSIRLNQIHLSNFNPFASKLMMNDHFKIGDTGNVEIVHSSVRTNKHIPAVLIISGNKTYGKFKNKLLYKCIPDDIRLPSFLIPYDMKKIGFSKVFKNKYISFYYESWNDKNPHGRIDQVIGDVDILDHFYEYQLYCKALHASIQNFQKDTSRAMQAHSNSHDMIIKNIRQSYDGIEDRTNIKDWYIFSIDPENCLDFDDAFSIKTIDTDKYLVSIYISNVSLLIDGLNLWNSFSERVSTIYLPDRKKPMLPTILSDSLCSLQENRKRLAFVMDFIIHNGIIVSIKYSNVCIEVQKNFHYQEPNLLGNRHYTILFAVVKELSVKYPYIKRLQDSHDLVAYLMVFMNYYSAKEMKKHNTGIFRSNITKDNESGSTATAELPENVGDFIKIWKSSSGQYIRGDSLETDDDTTHTFLNVDAYIHITSPIRRLVDLLNMIVLQEKLGIVRLSTSASKFYDRWNKQIDYINVTMRSIRKVQTDCDLLHLCTNNPFVLEKTYNGYIFDKVIRGDGLFQYVVYIPDIRMIMRIVSRDEFINYECKLFRLFLFHDEDRFKKKIRIHLL